MCLPSSWCYLHPVSCCSKSCGLLHCSALSLPHLLSGATGIPVTASPHLPSELLCRILWLGLGLGLGLLLLLVLLISNITSTTSSSLFFFFSVFSIATFYVKCYSTVPWRQYCIISILQMRHLRLQDVICLTGHRQ